MSKNSKTSTSGISTLSLLGVAFIVLKLCKVITWSWWWVTLPFWGGAVLVLGILVIVLIATILNK